MDMVNDFERFVDNFESWVSLLPPPNADTANSIDFCHYPPPPDANNAHSIASCNFLAKMESLGIE
jgi:hypothetical protein